MLRDMDTYRIRTILFSLKQGWVLGIQLRTGYQNLARSSLEQGQVSGGPVAHPHQNFCSVPPPPPSTGVSTSDFEPTSLGSIPGE